MSLRNDRYGDACDLASHRQYKHPKPNASSNSRISDTCVGDDNERQSPIVRLDRTMVLERLGLANDFDIVDDERQSN